MVTQGVGCTFNPVQSRKSLGDATQVTDRESAGGTRGSSGVRQAGNPRSPPQRPKLPTDVV